MGSSRRAWTLLLCEKCHPSNNLQARRKETERKTY